MRPHLPAILALAGLALLLPACGIFEKTQTNTLVPGGPATIVDVPVPAGFKYTAEGSWSDVKPELKQRSAVQNFYGKAALLRITEFYQDQLPKNKWSNTTAEQQPGRIIIRAAKPGETLTITAWDENFYTNINIQLQQAKR
jgi:hypothetical protein